MHVISWGGRQMFNIRKAWVETVKLSGLPTRYSPHILRHTRATWLMQKGVDMWEAAGSLGMTVGTLETTYGHHHPNWQKNAAEA
jgi:integrase